MCAYNNVRDSFAVHDRNCIQVYLGGREIKRMQFQNVHKVSYMIFIEEFEVSVRCCSDDVQ